MVHTHSLWNPFPSKRMRITHTTTWLTGHTRIVLLPIVHIILIDFLPINSEWNTCQSVLVCTTQLDQMSKLQTPKMQLVAASRLVYQCADWFCESEWPMTLTTTAVCTPMVIFPVTLHGGWFTCTRWCSMPIMKIRSFSSISIVGLSTPSPIVQLGLQLGLLWELLCKVSWISAFMANDSTHVHWPSWDCCLESVSNRLLDIGLVARWTPSPRLEGCVVLQL